VREDTHIVFGAGVSGTGAALLGCSMGCLLIALLANLLVHPLIDRLGHEKHWWTKHPRRHALTHSLLGATILGLAVYALLSYAAAPLIGRGDATLLALPVLLGPWSHLFLDMLNPSGIYLCGRRVTLRVARYNSVWANLLFQALGILLIAYSVAQTTL